jgi:taurine dioxygenase
MALEIRKLGEHTGAEVRGVDLSKPVDAETRHALNAALVEHVALVIRDQRFDADDFVSAASLFGEPMQQNYSKTTCEEQPLVNFISNTYADKDGKRSYHSGYWHTDHTNREAPPKYTTLYALELPQSGGGDTGILNTRAAYAALPDAWQRRLEELKTVNVYHGSAARTPQRYEGAHRTTDDVPVIHDLVQIHSENGEKAFYLHQGKLENFVGMTPEQSHDLVEELFALTVKPEFVYRHQWRLGDMLIWDNRQSMHQAYKDYDLDETRTLYRIILEPERPQ